MSVSVFLDTLRKHELDQFYPTFSTHGITHLQSLAQLSLQDYSRLGITDTGDRRKIFGLVQAIRKDSELSSPTTTTNSRMMAPSSSTANTSGLRQPQNYANFNNATLNSSRLPMPDFASSSNNNNSGGNPANRGRRQSVIGTSKPQALYNNGGGPPQPPQHDRPVRSRTMSDAPRPDFSQQRAAPLKGRRLELRRSLYLDQPPEDDDSEEDESSTKNRKFRASAPLLDAYGVPLSPAKQQQQQQQQARASPGTRYAETTANVSNYNLPPSDLNQKIRVCVRKRPLSKKEIDKGDKDVAPMNGNRSLQINEPKLKLDLTKYTEQHAFTFDDVFDLNCPNNLVYERTAWPLVNYIFKGGKATCFAYGQTGSGKTFTMLDPKQGLYIMAARDIFSMLRKPENQHLSAWIGLYEIYQGQLYDLLNERKKLFAREDGKNNVIISGLKEYPIDNVDKLIQVFDYGSSVRSTGSTGANDSSSRSHAVLQILLKHKVNRKKIHGKLSFIDLAGSERGADRGEADTKTRMEGAEINKSLLALKECIRALDQDKRHTPFRQSKLTQVLKDSFVGNSRTCMIATISPGGSNSEHTLNTLRYADRVKELKGERDRRSPMERNPSNSGSSTVEDSATNTQWTDSSPNDYEDYDSNEDEQFQDDSNDDYFSNESDILDDDTFNVEEENIFDVDFPQEQDDLIHSSNFNTPNISNAPKSPPRYGMVAASQLPSAPATSYKASNNYRPNSMSMASNYSVTNSSEHGGRPLSLQMKQSSSTLPRSLSMYSPSRTSMDTASDTSSTYSSSHQPPQRSMTVQQTVQQFEYRSSSSHQFPPPSSPQQKQSQPQSPLQQIPNSDSLSSLTGVPSFSYDKMDEFVKFHRAEIREITDCTKKETKLVANISLDLSSNQNFEDGSSSSSEKSTAQFTKYLQDLDEILERKLAAVEALRDRISETVGQIEL
ncbi:P-loop containing nucleoside triphosphate hydrolase protein [Mucor lusitanicus]|uniref:Kinesin-like protein n=1 Tax=Mucor circinelloides f. lusitanicus TaxID=29924 RepID=A0A8H4B7Y7_MUCCL|nr:P-loop containing nucleoside triphosphate hydrolase protein [Mucor lusitanicus]